MARGAAFSRRAAALAAAVTVFAASRHSLVFGVEVAAGASGSRSPAVGSRDQSGAAAADRATVPPARPPGHVDRHDGSPAAPPVPRSDSHWREGGNSAIAVRRTAASAAPVTAAAVTCPAPIDLIFVVDGSGSIGADNFELVRTFLCDASSRFTLDPTLARIGVVLFSGGAEVSIPLGSVATNQTALCESMLAIPYPTGGTNTWLGLDLAGSQLTSLGRPLSQAAPRLVMVVTDGQSGNAALTGAAADALRNTNAATVAVITIGPARNFNPGEVEHMAGYDPRLIVAIESWVTFGDSTDVLANVTTIACGASARNDDLQPVEAPIACNSTRFITYLPRNNAPITLLSNVTTGNLVLCYSYMLEQPTPAMADADYNGDGAPDVVCANMSASANGLTTIATTTAYPTTLNNSAASAPALYVSVTAIGWADAAGNTTGCGGNFTLTADFCTVQVATGNMTQVPGSGADAANATAANGGVPTFNTTQYGAVNDTTCASCPAGMVWLAASGPLRGVCGPRCPATRQFIDPRGIPGNGSDGTAGQAVCRDCDPSCDTCIYPGTPRSCTACRVGIPVPAPGPANVTLRALRQRLGTEPATVDARLLPSAIDPAYTSPYWLWWDAAVANATGGAVPSYRGDAAGRASIDPPPLPLTAAAAARQLVAVAGRCLPDACPLAMPALPQPPFAPASSPNATICNGTVGALAAATPAVLVTVAIVAPPPVSFLGAAATLCGRTGGAGLTGARLASQLATLLSLPSASVWLYSCLQLDGEGAGISADRTRYSWAYADSPATPSLTTTIVNASAQLANSSILRGCAATHVLTFAVAPAIAAPADAAFAASATQRALALSAFAANVSAIAARAANVTATLAAAFAGNATAGPQPAPPGPGGALPLSTNCSAAAAGAPVDVSGAVLLGTCFTGTTPIAAWLNATAISPSFDYASSDGTRWLSPLTLCPLELPPPIPLPPGNAITPVLAPPAIAGISTLLLLLLLFTLCCWCFCAFRRKRQLYVEAVMAGRLNADGGALEWGPEGASKGGNTMFKRSMPRESVPEVILADLPAAAGSRGGGRKVAFAPSRSTRNLDIRGPMAASAPAAVAAAVDDGGGLEMAPVSVAPATAAAGGDEGVVANPLAAAAAAAGLDLAGRPLSTRIDWAGDGEAEGGDSGTGSTRFLTDAVAVRVPRRSYADITSAMTISERAWEWLVPGSVSLVTMQQHAGVDGDPGSGGGSGSDSAGGAAASRRAQRVWNAMRRSAAAAPAPGPAAVPLVMGTGVVPVEMVKRETVALRHVGGVKGDSDFKGSAATVTFTAVVAREVVVDEEAERARRQRVDRLRGAGAGGGRTIASGGGADAAAGGGGAVDGSEAR